jgi:hypothetical protein
LVLESLDEGAGGEVLCLERFDVSVVISRGVGLESGRVLGGIEGNVQDDARNTLGTLLLA